MADTIFVITLVTYLVVATTLLYRSPAHGWGFPMFFMLYPIFLVAFLFASARVVMLVWLGLALMNMAFQYVYMRSTGAKKGIAAVLVSSLIFWPVQFAGVINSTQTEKEEQENRESNREKIGALPATINGTVSYVHHHGTEDGHDSVWLEEFGDLDFMTDSRTYDRIGIVEGKAFSLTVDERDAPAEFEVGKTLWIIDGKPGDN